MLLIIYLGKEEINMIRLLDGLVLLKEVDTIEGAQYSSLELRDMYPHALVVIRHNTYIYKHFLCKVAQEKATMLDDYIQLTELSEYASIAKELFQRRISFMKINNAHLFEWIKIANIIYIKMDQEFKHLIQNYQPFYANLTNTNLVAVKLIGDIKIGFY